MARNRRNTRRIRSIRDVLNMRTFLTIVGILMAIIIVCIGINTYKRHEDKTNLAKQKEEIEKQSEAIFASINQTISKTNQNISESDSYIKMSAVGDILCSEEMLEDAYNSQTKTYNFSHMFNKASGYITDADIIMGTMETGIVDSDYNGERAPVQFAKAVKNSGINLVTIAHNHSLDSGAKGIAETKKNLEDIGFDVIGDNSEENDWIIKEIKNTKIAFLTYTDLLDDKSSKTKKELESVNIFDEEQVKEDIKSVKNEGAKYICVMMHWGEAITENVSERQKEIADFLVQQGVDLILGSHPSVVQPMEIRQNKDGKNVFIAYSIGTYISTLQAEEARTELVLNIELRRSGTDGNVYLNKINYTPLYVLDNGYSADNRYQLIDLKSTIANYNSEDGTITEATYDKLVKAMERLNKVLGQ